MENTYTQSKNESKRLRNTVHKKITFMIQINNVCGMESNHLRTLTRKITFFEKERLSEDYTMLALRYVF